MSAIQSGLEGVVVASTKLSEVDGEGGHLVIGGYDVETLAGSVSFEAVCHLLWAGRLPSADEERTLSRALGHARASAFRLVEAGAASMDMSDGMDALRAAVAGLVSGREGREAEAISLTGAVGVFAAAHAARRAGREAIAPDAERSHAEDYLRMVGGRAPERARTRALDAYLVTVSDHGMNASTFAARVVASTGSDAVSAVTAAIGALKGPLHGGAPGPVLDMLDAIAAPVDAHKWLEQEIEAGRRIMGMGHRVYRVRDPRAAVLERALAELEREIGGGGDRLSLARAVERAAAQLLAKRYPDRALQANVEFYTAVLLEAVGLPRWLFSPTFAVGRVAGWCAHVDEQRARGRLIRPAALYDGPRHSTAS